MPEVKLPEKWSEWKVIEQVGMGSFGTVYKAELKLYVFHWKNKI